MIMEQPKNTKSFFGLGISFNDVESHLKRIFKEITKAEEIDGEYSYYIVVNILNDNIEFYLTIIQGKVTKIRIENADPRKPNGVIYDGSEEEKTNKDFDLLYNIFTNVIFVIESLFTKTNE